MRGICLDSKSLENGLFQAVVQYKIDNSKAFVISPKAKSPTTSSTGGLILALQRAILLLAPKGDVASTFTGPL